MKYASKLKSERWKSVKKISNTKRFLKIKLDSLNGGRKLTKVCHKNVTRSIVAITINVPLNYYDSTTKGNILFQGKYSFPRNTRFKLLTT